MEKKHCNTVCAAELGKTSVILSDNGEESYLLSGQQICRFYSCAKTMDGKRINTSRAELVSHRIIPVGDESALCLELVFRQSALTLRQEILLFEDGRISARISLHDEEKETQSNYLAPFVTVNPDNKDQALFSSHDQRMLLIPYDNDMWSRYESAVPACGRESYDVTAIYEEESLNGLIIGALDFDIWKNAIQWNPDEARSVIAYCGAAGAGTHDTCPHAPLSGEWVDSSRFIIFWCEDVRCGMEKYGSLCADQSSSLSGSFKPVPFGWNSYSALSIDVKISQWQEAGNFLKEELPCFCDDEGSSYINLDGVFGLDTEKIKKSVEKLHEKGQKAGWYLSPCCWFEKLTSVQGKDLPIADIFLKDDKGNPLPSIDGLIPLDVTHPEWEKMTRAQIRGLADLGMDYIKFDFLSHGSLEGEHYRKGYTGRMALNYAYGIISDEISRTGKDIFVSLSISPLFPCSFGDSRRSSCDVFGHHEDVRYALNALTFAWWANGRLYQYNDPDHISLYRSVVDGREASTENEARSRYNASVIAGTVMLLSDNYGPEGDPETISMSRKRAIQFANNPQLNEIARFGKAFVPVSLKGEASPFYTLSVEGRYFAAIFNFERYERKLSFEAVKGGLPARGTFRDVRGGDCVRYDGEIEFTLEGWDSVILEIKE